MTRLFHIFLGIFVFILFLNFEIFGADHFNARICTFLFFRACSLENLLGLFYHFLLPLISCILFIFPQYASLISTMWCESHDEDTGNSVCYVIGYLFLILWGLHLFF